MKNSILVVLAALLSLVDLAPAQSGRVYPYKISTAVGSYPYGDGVPAEKALLSYPDHMTIDKKGIVYIADTDNHIVRKIVSGQISIIAGTGEPGFSGDGQPATKAQLNSPATVAVDSSGIIYIYDTGNAVIRRVDTSGIITTFAGVPGKFNVGQDAVPANRTELALSNPGGLAVDSADNLYIAELLRVRKITIATNIIRTFAGKIAAEGGLGDGGPATSAHFTHIGGIAFDSTGNLYISDTDNSAIRRVSAANGTIDTVVGNSRTGFGGDGGPPKSASLNQPADVTLDAEDNLYIADAANCRIRKVTGGANPQISTIGGNSSCGYSGDGGPASAAALQTPQGVAVDAGGGIYVVDTYNNRIRSIRNGNIDEFAGADHGQGDGGNASSALLYYPTHLAWDSKNNLYISDTQNNKIRKVTPDGIITTVAGNGTFASTGDGGPAIAAGVFQPQGVAVDSMGNIYFSTVDQIRKVDSKGTISTVVNTSRTPGFNGDGQPGETTWLWMPVGLAMDSADNLYIADEVNNCVRKLSGGIVTTVAGIGRSFPVSPFGSFDGDGGPATSAHFTIRRMLL